jgi:nucleotide-binding universal stress UspA family protein
MKLIVAATDFTPAATAATRRAAQLAAACGGRLSLLHVVRHRSAWKRIARLAPPLAELHRQAARLRVEYRVPVEAYVAKGAPYREIAAFSSSAGADIIVLGVRAGFLHDLLDTATAQRVRRRVSIPVLAVARDPSGPYRRILVATDFSAASAAAARLASRLFPSAALHLLHVREMGAGGAASAVRKLSRFAAQAGLSNAILDVAVGSAAQAIRQRAGKLEAELVVTAPPRRSWFGEILLFGVTDAMLSRPERDTLIIPEARGLRVVAFNEASHGSVT